jgi:glycosyltransferase involved in cell wall biosynthesis
MNRILKPTERADGDYPLVSVLFITYRRFDSLRLTMEAFNRNTDYPNLELVIADDGSDPETQARIRTLPADRFALAERNRGLGANNNAGLRLCTGKYVLMIQDDCVCYGPREYLREAVNVMEANPDVGIINFAAILHPPDRSKQLSGSHEPCFITPTARDGEWGFLYTDQPHIRSMESVRLVGYYSERRDMESVEAEYARRWQNQTKFRTAVFPGYHRRVFRHDDGVPSFRKNSLKNRGIAKLLPVAQWLKGSCRPLYRLSRSGYYSFIRILELLGLVR